MNREMNKEKLATILDLHDKWLKNIEGGEKADLRGADLRGADLRGANLQGASLLGADLQDADLQGADLWGADLQRADLRGADLWGVNLWGADLRGADLRGANLRGANLWGVNLWGEKIDKSPLQVVNLGYFITITKQHINIGCKVYKAEEWFAFSDEEIQKMDDVDKAINWWNKNKEFVRNCWLKHCEE